MNSFRLESVYPYLSSLKEQHELKKDNNSVSTHSGGEKKIGPPVQNIVKSQMSNLLGWSHRDGLFIIFNSEKKRVVEYQISHGNTIEDCIWLNEKDNSFLSASSDGYLMKWELVNDKWTPKILDVSARISL